MTVKELYEKIGGNYDEALRRLSMDALIGKFIVRFLDDTSCGNLIRVWENQDEKELFEAAHAAKGVCANLALASLSEIASKVTEASRPGNEAQKEEIDLEHLMEEFKERYESAVTEIRAFSAQ